MRPLLRCHSQTPAGSVGRDDVRLSPRDRGAPGLSGGRDLPRTLQDIPSFHVDNVSMGEGLGGGGDPADPTSGLDPGPLRRDATFRVATSCPVRRWRARPWVRRRGRSPKQTSVPEGFSPRARSAETAGVAPSTGGDARRLSSPSRPSVHTLRREQGVRGRSDPPLFLSSRGRPLARTTLRTDSSRSYRWTLFGGSSSPRVRGP